MKPLVQLVHSLKSRMESPDYEMVGHCIKEQKVGNFQNICSTGREKVTFNFRLDSLIQYFFGILIVFFMLLLRAAFFKSF